MHGPMIAAAVLAAALCCGLSAAGEDDIMLMRGDSGDGKTRVNSFQANLRMSGWVGPAVDGTTESAVSPSAILRDEGFLAWKNNCVTMPPVVGGKPVTLRKPDGYEQVGPYILQPTTEGAGYRDLLAEEIEDMTREVKER